MCAVGIGTADDVRAIVEEQRDLAALHGGGDRLGAIDQATLIAIREPQQYRGDIAGAERRVELAQQRRGVVDEWRDEVKAGSDCYAALRSRSAFHSPRAARPFIMARWLNARCAAATFSDLPDHAFCGAACNARP
jgi:hypothetical protein